MVAPSDPEEEEEFQTERKRSRFKTTARKHVTPQSTLTLNLNNNETPARKHVTPQSCKPQNRQNRWAQSDITEDDDDEVRDESYDPNKDKKDKLRSNIDFSSDSNTDSDDHSEGPAEKKRKNKSEEAYVNNLKSVLNFLDEDKVKEENSIKISKDLFGGNKNRKRPSPRNQDEKENQPKYQMISDDEDSKSKKEPKKSFATDLVNVYQIEVVPKSSGKDLSHNKQHMCTFCK